jgi:ribosome biogenesis GTPase
VGTDAGPCRPSAGGGELSTLGENWDNDDVRVRPTRSSRPRTKTRPTHTDAVTGFVTTVDRGRYTCLVEEGSKRAHVVTAMRARELGRRAVAVGDLVDIVGDTDGKPDTLARIVRIAPRRSVLRRSADDTDPAERVLVANADQLVIVCALADPVPRTGFIDRCLVAAYTGNLDAVLVLTKADLADPAPLAAIYADLELPILVTRRGVAADGSRTVDGIEAVQERLDRSVSVMIGHSGVGKSTLVNALVPDAKRATGSVTGVGKGRHTSTSAIALPLRAGGWVIDTPGVRSFGLAHVTPDDLLETFDDLLPGTVNCPPNCDHTGADGGADTTGVGCALDAYVAAGNSSPGRLASFRRLLASRSGSDDSIRDDSDPDADPS